MVIAKPIIAAQPTASVVKPVTTNVLGSICILCCLSQKWGARLTSTTVSDMHLMFLKTSSYYTTVWGWTDISGNEIAIVGCDSGTSFVDITDPLDPYVVGFLPTQTVRSGWRDMKVYNNHVYIGSEATNHGIQVFELSFVSTTIAEFHADSAKFGVILSENGRRRLNVTFSTTALYTGVGKLP